MTSLIPLSDMKKILFIGLFFATAATVFAALMSDFRSWDDLIGWSPDIVIAKCIPSPPDNSVKKPLATIDNVNYSDIEVISVLKGNTKPGQSRMASQYCPCDGEQFLLFAEYGSNQFYRGYTAMEEYRVVPINNYFQTNQLSGKTLYGQIQLLLSNRLSDINEEVKRDNEEKNRIQEFLKEKQIYHK
jgi:hypothetical protein